MHYGEQRHQNAVVVEEDDMSDCGRMDEMLDARRPEFKPDSKDTTTPEVQKIFGLLKA